MVTSVSLIRFLYVISSIRPRSVPTLSKRRIVECALRGHVSIDSSKYSCENEKVFVVNTRLVAATMAISSSSRGFTLMGV